MISGISGRPQTLLDSVSRWGLGLALLLVLQSDLTWGEGRVTQHETGETVFRLEFEGQPLKLRQPLAVIVDGVYQGKAIVTGLSSSGLKGKARVAAGTVREGALVLTVREYRRWQARKRRGESLSSDGVRSNLGPTRLGMRADEMVFLVQGGLGLEMGAELIQGGMPLAVSLGWRSSDGTRWDFRFTNLSSRLKGDFTRETQSGPLTSTYDEALSVRFMMGEYAWLLGDRFWLGLGGGLAQFSGASGGSSFYPAAAVQFSYEHPFNRSFFAAASVRPNYVLIPGNPLFSSALFVEGTAGLGVRF